MFFPFMVEMSGNTVIVVGGGNVAFRKCLLFLECGAEVTVISPSLCQDFAPIMKSITHTAAPYSPELISSAAAVIAATDSSEVNSSISSHCRSIGIPVNVVDVPELCTFYVPAILRRGDLTIAVSTGGTSPALAAKIKKELSETYKEDYTLRTTLLGLLRQKVKEQVSDPAKRRKILSTAAEMDANTLALHVSSFHPDLI